METTYKIILLIIITSSCQFPNKNTKNNHQKETIMSDQTLKVTGIGGIFFRSKSPKDTREWYGKNLGLAINEYGSLFEFRNANRPDEINFLN